MSAEDPEEGELEKTQDELNESTTEVNVLHDILGLDSETKDEFQEELENDDTLATVEPVEVPKAARRKSEKKTKKSGKPSPKKSPTKAKQSKKTSASKDSDKLESSAGAVAGTDRDKAGHHVEKLDKELPRNEEKSKKLTSESNEETSETEEKGAKPADEMRLENKIDSKVVSPVKSAKSTKKKATSAKSASKRPSSKTGKSAVAKNSSSSMPAPSAAKQETKTVTTATEVKDEGNQNPPLEQSAGNDADDSRMDVDAHKEVGFKNKSEDKKAVNAGTDVNVKGELSSESGAGKKRKDAKVSSKGRQEGEASVEKKKFTDGAGKLKKAKAGKAKESSDSKAGAKKEKSKSEKQTKKEKVQSKAKQTKDDAQPSDANDKHVEVDLQDNKDDMQVIDDVAESDDLHDSDDVISNHYASGFEDMSSISGSISRSRSRTPMSSSRSRSRSGSKASSDSFEKLEKAEKERSRKRKLPENEQTFDDDVKSKVSKAMSESNQKALDDFLRGSRYFIIKSNNYENVSLSKAKAVWSTPPANERKLNDAYRHAANVILIFSVKESGRFQGFCRLASESKRDGPIIPWVLPPGFDRRILGGVFKVDWLNRHECPFMKCSHLRNPWNENKEIKICRDGQEVEPSIGEALCRLFPMDEHVDLARILRHRRNDKRRESPSAITPASDHCADAWKYIRMRFCIGQLMLTGLAIAVRPRVPKRGEERHRSSYHRRHRDSPPDKPYADPRRRRPYSGEYDDYAKGGRSKYGVKKETLLHGSYADYIREFEKSRQMRPFGAPPAMSSYHHEQQHHHQSTHAPRYSRAIDPSTAAAEAFLQSGYDARNQGSYRSRR
eukprot:gene7822-8671_t